MRSILVYGDSNSYGQAPMRSLGGPRERYGENIRWPGLLRAALGPDWRVIEEALPGRTTVLDDPIEGAHKNGLTHLPVALESHAPIDGVIVMLGVNDLKMRYGLPPEDIAMGAGRLLAFIKASIAGPGGRAPALMLIGPPFIEEVGVLGPMFSGGAAKSRRLGPLYEAVAATHGAAFIDAAPIARVSPIDGIHLDEGANASLAAAVVARCKAGWPLS